MSISELPQSIWDKVSFQLSNKNISTGWKITRNIAGGVFVAGSLLTGPICPFVLPATATVWIGWITLIGGVISGRAQLDTSKIKK